MMNSRGKRILDLAINKKQESENSSTLRFKTSTKEGSPPFQQTKDAHNVMTIGKKQESEHSNTLRLWTSTKESGLPYQQSQDVHNVTFSQSITAQDIIVAEIILYSCNEGQEIDLQNTMEDVTDTTNIIAETSGQNNEDDFQHVMSTLLDPDYVPPNSDIDNSSEANESANEAIEDGTHTINIIAETMDQNNEDDLQHTILLSTLLNPDYVPPNSDINNISEANDSGNEAMEDVTHTINIIAETTDQNNEDDLQHTRSMLLDPDYVPLHSDFDNISEANDSSNEAQDTEIDESQLLLQSENNQPIENNKARRNRSKRQNVNERTWDVKRQKLGREKGLQYKGKEKIDGKYKYSKTRDARRLKPRCKCTSENNTIKCSSFDDNDRENIFRIFWNKTWEEKKMYIQLLTETNTIKRPRDRKNDDTTRRSCTFKYYLKKNDERIRVCKTFFLHTLDIGEWSVRNWKKESIEERENFEGHQKSKEMAGFNKSASRQKMFQERKDSLDLFFGSLAKVESHYCRASTSKLYLEPLWKSKNGLYNFYVEDWCASRNETPLSVATFAMDFQNKNLSLYSPKKDLCDICVGHQTKNISDEEFNLHQLKKEEARQEKGRDKENEHHVYTMDLQGVLLSPRSNVSSMYYKTKLAVHNFTLYNLKSKDGHCFIWNETEGNLTAEEFATIIGSFILSLLPLEDRKVILYSDGCGYQNRNVTLSNTLLNISMTENITIEQKFLEKVHTQMEVDSMHSSIERVLRNTKINVPADYANVCERARRTPAPYTVHYLEYSYFKNLTSVQFFNTIRPGKKVGEPVVTDIRALRYTPDGTIFYKLRFTEEWSSLPTRKNKTIVPKRFQVLPQLYDGRQKIKKTKFEHLQLLKRTLEPDYHNYYDNIPHTD